MVEKLNDLHMPPNFKYFDPQDLSFKMESYNLALSEIAENKLILDSAYLPVIEAAHRGSVAAVCEIAILFGSGAPGLPKNYTMAKFYVEVLKAHSEGDPKPEIEAWYHSGILEYEQGNYEAANSEFLQAAKIMVEHLPPVEWDYRVFENLETLSRHCNTKDES